jgi:hypothetical protein
MTCKGICVRYKAQKPVGTGRYASGQRRCQICEIFIKWEGLWCPCCGYRLRTKPRNLKYKAKLRARVEADSIEAKAIAQEQPEEIVEEVAVVKPKATKTTAKKATKTTAKKAATKTTAKKATKTTAKKATKTTAKKATKTTAKKATKTTAKVIDQPETESIAIKA